MDQLTSFLLVVLPMAVLLVVLLIMFQLLVGYKIREKDVAVLLFHCVPIYWIPFKKIEKIYSAPMYQTIIIPGMHMISRIFGKRVVIERKDGSWFKFTFLTPKDSDAFIAEVRRRI